MKKLIIALALVATAAQAEDAADLRTDAALAAHEMREQMFAESVNAPELKGVSDDTRRLSIKRVVSEYTAKVDQNIAAELAQGHTCDEMLAGLKEKDRAYIQQNPQKTAFVIAGEKYLKNKCALTALEMP